MGEEVRERSAFFQPHQADEMMYGVKQEGTITEHKGNQCTGPTYAWHHFISSGS